jgi:nitrate/TMAO reductase-like tetraheme cytochrome c subunit
MSVKKRLTESAVIWDTIVIACSVIMCLFVFYALDIYAQNLKKSTTLSETARIEVQSFLDSNYKNVTDLKNVLRERREVHPLSAVDTQCNKCHEVHKTDGAEASYIVFREDSVQLLSNKCLGCHPMTSSGHPNMVKPSIPIPKDFPLSHQNELTCISCHNPHFQRYSNRSWLPRTYLGKAADIIRRKKQFNTYFLRRNNAKKELCLACHQGVRQDWGFYNQP